MDVNGFRVLVISSDAPVADLLTEVLQAQAYEVRAIAAIERPTIDQFDPQLIVLHVSRTSETELPAAPRFDRPLIVIGSPQRRDVASRLGARSFWPLPVEIAPFLRAVADISQEKSAGPRLAYSRRERRSGTRPKVGDVKPCQHCGDAMRFLELRVTGAAWVCRNPECLVVTLVRANH